MKTKLRLSKLLKPLGMASRFVFSIAFVLLMIYSFKASQGKSVKRTMITGGEASIRISRDRDGYLRFSLKNEGDNAFFVNRHALYTITEPTGYFVWLWFYEAHGEWFPVEGPPQELKDWVSLGPNEEISLGSSSQALVGENVMLDWEPSATPVPKSLGKAGSVFPSKPIRLTMQVETD